jgi:hypothetical protein
VEEVEQTKREGGAWSSPGGREPPNAKQLDTWWNCVIVWAAFAVSNSDCMDAGDIEDRDGDGRGGYGTRTSVAVAKVQDSTEVCQRHLHEVSPTPTLRRVSVHTKLSKYAWNTCKWWKGSRW